MRIWFFAVYIVLAFFFANPPLYAVTNKEIQVAARIFEFIKGVPDGSLSISIVYDPSNELSKNEAETLHKSMSAGLEAGKYSFVSRLVTVSEIESLETKIIYVTSGLDSYFHSIFVAARKVQALSFSNDFACVEAHKCVMSVAADPEVKIVISRSATKASGFAFATALRLMVSRVD